jgi:hypothetical protein
MKLQNAKQYSISPRWHLPEGITSIVSYFGSVTYSLFTLAHNS